MNQIVVDAPCKINLALDILSKKPDGYHEIDTVMQAVSLQDRLTVRLTDRFCKEPEITITCSVPNVPTDRSNIVFRCAEEFLRETGIKLVNKQIQVHIDKTIPMMAGLGGGSADGAGILAALNVMFETGLTEKQLCVIGQKLGADIPFCIVGGTARAQGIGEIITKLEALPDFWIVIAKPMLSIQTKEAFAAWDRQESNNNCTARLMESLQNRDRLDIACSLGNVFEELCGAEERKGIEELKRIIRDSGALGALMSGSGSAVYGLFDDQKKAEACRVRLGGNPLTEAAFLTRPVITGPVVRCQ